jgi:hypothetical protein
MEAGFCLCRFGKGFGGRSLLRICTDQGIVTEVMLREDTRWNPVRHDAFEVFDRLPDLASPGKLSLNLAAAWCHRAENRAQPEPDQFPAQHVWVKSPNICA